jgi:histidinol-phosphate/aromatic aminotransferase/cobyric acid decarboxylase-like protein
VLARRPGIDLKPLQGRLKAEGILVRHFETPELRDALRITVGTHDEIAALLASESMRP